MRLFRYFIVIAVLASAALCFAQKEDWLPITDQDLNFKEVPGNRGAPAVRLYYAHYIDDNTSSEFIYERIKILNDKGKKYADVEIPVRVDNGLYAAMTDLKARTIHPDGSIVEFTGKPFEKTLYKGRGTNIAAKAFTMPEVSVGSIIEYKFRFVYSTAAFFSSFVILFSSDEWVIQSDLYTVKEYLDFKPYEGGVYKSHTKGSFDWQGAQVSRVAFNLKETPKSKGNEAELELQNVPAFEPEDYMAPENNYKPSVVFFYSRKGIGSADKEWEEIGKAQDIKIEEFLGRNHDVKEAATQSMGGESDPGVKLYKLYERAQKVRNLSYERPRTEEERKKEKILTNDGVGDVLTHGYGTSQEITELFVALARAAGFNASVAQVSDRKKRFFSKEWTTLRQIDSLLAVVTVNGADLYLEPGARFCPYGLLPWSHTAVTALKLDKKGGTFVTVPAATQDKAITTRVANVTLAEDGSLKGDVTIEFRGQEALEQRLDAVDKDEAGKKKGLEDRLKAWLPSGSVVNMTISQGWDGTDQPLAARFVVEVPAYASVAGNRLLLPSSLFQITQIEAFKHSDRKYPVYFPYAFTELDRVNLKLPAGFKVETVPEKQDASLPYARYQNISQSDNTQLVMQRALRLNGVYFPLERYSELKGFFSKVQTGDEQQVVLHGGGTSAQKGN